MAKNAARIGDMHVNPGGGGPILEGCASVIIGGQPAARVGDKAQCGSGTDTIAQGAPAVIIAGKAASRLGDAHTCGGKIVNGCATVIIGNYKGSAALKLRKADCCIECLLKALKTGAPVAMV